MREEVFEWMESLGVELAGWWMGDGRCCSGVLVSLLVFGLVLSFGRWLGFTKRLLLSEMLLILFYI